MYWKSIKMLVSSIKTGFGRKGQGTKTGY